MTQETGLSSYGKVWALGHRNVASIFNGPVSVEEKIDGSQFSFGKIDGRLLCRSRSVNIDMDAPDQMFAPAVEVVRSLEPKLHDGWTYRGEYLKKPKHNTLAYDRIPTNHIVLFDVDRGQHDCLDPDARREEAARLGLEAVPIMYVGEVKSLDQVVGFMDRVSVLGGQAIEGLVFKNHQRFSDDGKFLKAKHVSERFKEIHQKDWKDRHPNRGDVVEEIIQSLRTESRWEKAIQHLRDRGELQNEPRDIGLLIRELSSDLEEECGEYIRDQLYKWARKQVLQGVTRGFPEWYKERLAASQFEGIDSVREARS